MCDGIGFSVDQGRPANQSRTSPLVRGVVVGPACHGGSPYAAAQAGADREDRGAGEEGLVPPRRRRVVAGAAAAAARRLLAREHHAADGHE